MMPLLAVLFSAQAAAAPFPAPDCSAVPGWTQQGPERSYDPETLFDYMNGNSEGYFAYGFTLMKGVTCVNAAGDQLVIDVSEMGDPDRAWGFFVTNRDQRSPVETIGSAGQVLPRRATFAKGRHYVEIAASPDKDHREALRAFVTALEASVPGEGRVPDAVAWFPTEGLEPGLDPARAGERPRPAHAEERLHGAVRGGPGLRRARGEPGGGGGHDGEAPGSLRGGDAGRAGSATRPSRRRTSTSAACSSSARARAWPASRTSAAGGDPSRPREGAPRPAALGPQANSVWARVSRRATSTPCGQRTAHSAQSPQRTSRWAAGIARKCSRPSPNCP